MNKIKNGWITDEYGDKLHYKDDVLHNEDGPAIIYSVDGTKVWYTNGKRHRTDGPAVTDNNGYKAWCINGKRHREDGPAIIYSDGDMEWFINDTEYTFKEYCSILELSQEQIVKLTLKYNI